MPYNSLADVFRLLAERYDNKSNVKMGGFRSQLQASNVSNQTEKSCDTMKQSVFLKGISTKNKHKETCPGFELCIPIPFPTEISVTLRAHPKQKYEINW